MRRAPPRAAAGQIGEPVHQMRVALRRLRSLAGRFRPVVGCADLDAARLALKELASTLGPARDWDVFIAGTGAAVAEALPNEADLTALLGAAEVRRAAAYAALADWLASPAMRDLAVRLAVLVAARPWQVDGTSGAPQLVDFGAHLLARQRRKMLSPGSDVASLPAARLHDIRLSAKRLRYAAEVFAPLYPGRAARRFLRRLAALQDALGLLNDGEVAATLMHELATEGGRGHAGGLVRGFVAGRSGDARARIAATWRKFRKAEVFWA